LNEYYKPPMPIPFEASAVHHITNKMVADRVSFNTSPRYEEIKALFESPDTYVVAHNSAFDVAMLSAEDIHPTHVICTYKVIRHLDIKKEFANHKLQYLRYALDIDLDLPAHDAFADVVLLEKVFAYLLARIMKEQGLSREDALKKMEELSSLPVLIREFDFGKHKGKTLEEVAVEAPEYLSWLLAEKQKNPIGEEDWIYTLKHYLKV
jgi:DNA polymerase III epsilon subunit-like protein